MRKLQKMILEARKKRCDQYIDYDYSKLSTAELKELISEDITVERMHEILDPVRFVSTDKNGYRKKLERLTEEELMEMADKYEKIANS